MSVDRRGRRAAESLATSLREVSPSRSDLEARQRAVQRRRMRSTLAAFVVLVLIAVPVIVLGESERNERPAAPVGGDRPEGTLDSGAWSSVPLPTSGLGDGSVVAAMASTTDAVVAVGSRSVDGSDVSAAWRSEDGFTWALADGPGGAGRFTAVGADGDALLAVGTAGSGGGPVDAVWRSDDGGRSWGRAAERGDAFGAPAPSGRPFVSQIVRVDGRWVAGGGAADGTGETWVSDDGSAWTATFPPDRTGGPDVAQRSDGSLLAYWGDQAWTSPDGVTWTARRPSLPAGLALRVVADGAAVGVGVPNVPDPNDPYSSDTPLLRSSDDGLTWVTDPSFLAAGPDTSAYAAAVVDGVTVVGGSDSSSGSGSVPMAAASADPGRWLGLAGGLTDGQRSGGIAHIASVGRHVVLMPGGPVPVAPDGPAPPPVGRYFVLDLDRMPQPEPAAAEPSQSAADAARDHVSPTIAALPVDARVDVQAETQLADGRRLVVSQLPEPTRRLFPQTGCLMGPSGTPGIDYLCATEWAEVLLMDGDRIERAWPMPTVPPRWAYVDGPVVYLGAVGDGALPASTAVRIDLRAGDAQVIVDRNDQPDPVTLPGWREATPAEAETIRSAVSAGDGALLAGPTAGAVEATLAVLAPRMWVHVDQLRPLFGP